MQLIRGHEDIDESGCLEERVGLNSDLPGWSPEEPHDFRPVKVQLFTL